MKPPFSDGYVFGQAPKWRKVNGLVLMEVTYAAGQHIPEHSHEHTRFILVLRGAFTETCHGRTRTCDRSTMIMRAPGDIHAEWVHPQGAVCLVVDLPPAWIEQMCGPTEMVCESTDFRGGLLKNLAWRLYDEFNKRDETAREWIEQLMQGIMAEAARRHAHLIERHPPGWLVQVKDALHAQFAGPLLVPLAESLTPSVMAASVGVHPVHLARAFRQWYHCTPSDYIHHLRMDFAQRALLESDAPLVDIALAAGFYDQSHFSRSFKRHTGMTPTQYRSMNRSR